MRKKVLFGPLTAIMDVLALGLAIAALAPLFAGTGTDSKLAEVGKALFDRLAPLTACLSVLVGATAFARIMAGYRKVYWMPWRAGFTFLFSCLSLLFALQAML